MRALTGATLLAFAAQPALAQTAFELDEITFSANRTPSELASTGSSVSVLTEDDLREAGDIQLSAILSRLPGVSLTQQGPLGQASLLRIRGADRRYIAVFVDGIRVDDASGIQTSFDFGAMTAADVGRVELLRGSQSALYGGSAVGGVINITTRAAAELGLTQNVDAEVGSFGTRTATYGVTHRTESGFVALNMSRVRSDGFSAVDAGTEPDGFDATRLSFTGAQAVSEAVTLGVSGFWQRSDADYDNGFPLEDADNRSLRRERGVRAFAEIDQGETRHVVGIGSHRISRRFVEQFADNTYIGERVRFDYTATKPINDGLTLVFGSDAEREAYDQFGTFGGFESSTTVGGVFVQALTTPADGLDLGVTARVDRHSEFGSFATGRVALAWRIADDLTLRSSIANGFRAPSNFELFSAFGDAELQAERSLSLDLGVEYRLGAAEISATLFELTARDAIDFDGALSRYNNIAKTRSRGLELALSLPLGERAELGLDYTYTDARITGGPSAGERQPRVPRHALTLRANAEIATRWSGHVAAQVVAGRAKDSVGAAETMPSYAVVNAGISYDLTDKAVVNLRVENLFDKQYQTVAGYGTSDRAVYVGLSSRF
jgi:vitamin B12 transporter